jgi:hypothetical protein
LAELNAFLWRELRRLDALEILHEDEIVVDFELVMLGTDPIALIVTDQRVLGLRTSTFGRRTRLVSLALDEIEKVEASSDRWLGREKGVLRLSCSGDNAEQEFVFRRVVTARRAEEIADAIVRERAQKGRGSASAAPCDAEAEHGGDQRLDAHEWRNAPSPLAFAVGRGVAEYVNRHGGRLYIWSEPFGGRFDKMRADTERPDDVEFVCYPSVAEFELFVPADFMPNTRVRALRRWWGLRRGVVIDTGLQLGGGAGP